MKNRSAFAASRHFGGSKYTKKYVFGQGFTLYPSAGAET